MDELIEKKVSRTMRQLHAPFIPGRPSFESPMPIPTRPLMELSLLPPSSPLFHLCCIRPHALLTMRVKPKSSPRGACLAKMVIIPQNFCERRWFNGATPARDAIARPGISRCAAGFVALSSKRRCIPRPSAAICEVYCALSNMSCTRPSETSVVPSMAPRGGHKALARHY
ncbi:hypothetical protein IF2G_00827 [Cordyceps javanica]|nr:hypothetical protein IF2G_00827 [Cordyceps javanica]